jgi:hypothetical protein
MVPLAVAKHRGRKDKRVEHALVKAQQLEASSEGAAVGTALAGGQLLSGSVPSLARGVPAGVSARATAPANGGYWLISSNRVVYAYGGAATYGDMAGKHLNAPTVGIVAAPDGKGYWLLAKDGGVFAFGSARFYNSLPGLHAREASRSWGWRLLRTLSCLARSARPGQPGPWSYRGHWSYGPAGAWRRRLRTSRACGRHRRHRSSGVCRRYGPNRSDRGPRGAGHSERQGRRVWPDDVDWPEPLRGRELSRRYARDWGAEARSSRSTVPSPSRS